MYSLMEMDVEWKYLMENGWKWLEMLELCEIVWKCIGKYLIEKGK